MIDTKYTILDMQYEQHEDIEFLTRMHALEHLQLHEVYQDFTLLIYDAINDEVAAVWFEGKMWSNGLGQNQ